MIKLPASKSRIDKAGRTLSRPESDFDENYLEEFVELESVFDKFRESHLKPLTDLTSRLQQGLDAAGHDYYIAQRLKRKPQILRKMNRLSVRLTQLQDIGGLRIIANDDTQADRIAALTDEIIAGTSEFKEWRVVDYRPAGRDDSGYRALHKILEYGPLKLELQLRSRAQHYWAESVERTSVFYGKRLKEGEGSALVLGYFKNLSNLFAAIERGEKRPPSAIANLDRLRDKAEMVIRRDGFAHLMDGYVNEEVVRTMLEKEKANPGRFNNWILVFDWNKATFVTWEVADRDTDKAVEQYARYEKEFPEDQKYEVVLIGSSDVATVQKTHSHYFGLASPDTILEDLGESVRKFSDDIELDYGARKILDVLVSRKTWGMKKGIQLSTLQNHFCRDVPRLDDSLKLLIQKGFVISKGGAGVTLNVAMTDEIRASL